MFKKEEYNSMFDESFHSGPASPKDLISIINAQGLVVETIENLLMVYGILNRVRNTGNNQVDKEEMGILAQALSNESPFNVLIATAYSKREDGQEQILGALNAISGLILHLEVASPDVAVATKRTIAGHLMN